MNIKDLTQEQLDELKAIDCPLRDCKYWQVQAMIGISETSFNGTFPIQHMAHVWGSATTPQWGVNTCYRIHPDYYPEHLKPKPEVEKWIKKDLYQFNHKQTGLKHWGFSFGALTDIPLSIAPDIVGFGGVLFKEWEELGDDTGWSMNTALQVPEPDSAMPATPQKVRFLNPEWEGEE